MTICETCSYPYESVCANPACLANPTLTKERWAAIYKEQTRRENEQQEREFLARAREAAHSYRRNA